MRQEFRHFRIGFARPVRCVAMYDVMIERRGVGPQKGFANPKKSGFRLGVEGLSRVDSGVNINPVGIDDHQGQGVQPGEVVSRHEAGRVIAARHAVREQRLDPAIGPPDRHSPMMRFAQRIDHHVLVIALQTQDQALGAEGDQPFDHRPAGGAAINIVAEQNDPGRATKCMGVDPLKSLGEQIVPAMDIADGIGEGLRRWRVIEHPVRAFQSARRGAKSNPLYPICRSAATLISAVGAETRGGPGATARMVAVAEPGFFDEGGGIAGDRLGRWLFIGAAAVMLIAGFFGGASRDNPLRLALVESVALPLAALTLRRLVRRDRWRGVAAPLVFLAGLFIIPLLQSLPLPPEIWTTLPGRDPRLEALDLAGLGPDWAPVSLAPRETLAMMAALLPPAAVFLAVLQSNRSERRALAALWVALSVVGLLFGMAQRAMPAGGGAYFYAVTNLGSVVGLFANRNHEAVLLVAVAPLAVALALNVRVDAVQRPPRGPGAWLAGLYLAVAVVALAAIQSRAGVILAVPGIGGALILLVRHGRSPGRRRTPVVIGAVVLAAVGAVMLFAQAPLLDRFVGGAAGEFRLEAWPYVLKAAEGNLPFGAGLGAFDMVFRAVEPLHLVGDAYFNHAHNDYLELWLETGWIGAALIAGFAVWLGWVAAVVGGDPLARAASLCVLVLMAHSLVDYPLRTETLATLFAFCCGVLAVAARASRRAWA